MLPINYTSIKNNWQIYREKNPIISGEKDKFQIANVFSYKVRYNIYI